MPRAHALLQNIVSEFKLLDYCHASTVAGTIALINLIMRQINKINTTSIRKLSFTPCPRHLHTPHQPTTPQPPFPSLPKWQHAQCSKTP